MDIVLTIILIYLFLFFIFICVLEMFRFVFQNYFYIRLGVIQDTFLSWLAR